MVTVLLIFNLRIPGILTRIRIYLEVGGWLHMIALLSFFFSTGFFRWVLKDHDPADWPESLWLGFLFLHLVTLPLFAELDAYSRFQDYKLMKDLLYHYGFQTRIIRSFRFSRCQRMAAFYAARDLGYKYKITGYFKACGYRWYHILPDFLWSDPAYLVSGHFWTTTFFTRTYYPKYYRD
jgi:hypothetical protein